MNEFNELIQDYVKAERWDRDKEGFVLKMKELGMDAKFSNTFRYLLEIIPAKAIEFAYNNHHLVLSGDTYDVKNTLKKYEFRWDGEEKCWWINK